MATITWPQLIVLMCFGDGTDDSISGEVHVRDVQPIAGDIDAADLDLEGGTIVEHPYSGRALVREYGFRVHRRGELMRRESLDGAVQMIEGTDTTWARFTGDDALTAMPRTTHAFAPIGGLGVGGPRPSLSRWEGTDFTHLAGPVEQVEFLGRPAWAFELEPPSHKPYPLQMVVDAATGLVLQQANRDFGSHAEYTSLQVGADLADSMFAWDGPSKAHRDHDAEAAEGVRLLSDRGITAPRLSGTAELYPHDVGDDGSFVAALTVHVHASLARRPFSVEPWPRADEMHFPYSHRWTDGEWEFCLGCEQPLSDGDLAALKAHLAGST